MADFLLWVISTLFTVTLAVIIAERIGIEVAIGIYAALIVLSNLIAGKLITVFTFVAPAAVIVYSSTFLITDILCELYGKEYARKAVIAGFFASILAMISIAIAVRWEAAPFVSKEFVKSYEMVFSMTPRIIIASIIAYVISQTHDVYAFHFWKGVTGGKYLWLRNNASTLVSQLIDTTIFITLAFWNPGMPIAQLLAMITGQYVIKIAIALLDTPFIYAATATHARLRSVEVA
jgi:hypothetical protein